MILKILFIILLSGSVFAKNNSVEFNPGLVAGSCEVGHHQVFSHKVMNPSSIEQINKAMEALIRFSKVTEAKNPRQKFLHGEVSRVTQKLIGQPAGAHSPSDQAHFEQEFTDIF